MRNHTLMQTIARANRVFGEKVNGLIVDYIGIFRDLQKALAIYGSAVGGEVGKGEMPVEVKAALVDELRDAIGETKAYLAEHHVHLGGIQSAEGFLRVRLLDEAVRAIIPLDAAADALLVNDDTKQQYLSLANKVELLFQAILPDVHANEFGVDRKAIVIIADKIRSLTHPADISSIMDRVESLLDQSIAPKGYKISDTKIVDLSQVDFEKLKAQFEQGHKRIEIEKLRGRINNKLIHMLQLNKSRMNFYEQFQKLIAEYNSGAKNADAFFAQLVTFAQSLSEEEKRGVSESLTEEELALFDILTRPNIKLSRKEKETVKKVAQELLDTLKAERLVLDWRKKQQTRAAVQITIEQILESLPPAYSDELYKEKCNVVYQHVFDAYYGSDKSIYA
jgi:type I restriction enzyme R subunit